MEDEVILVDEKDKVQGKEFKTAAHEKGMLHRAFSIFIYNTRGEVLLQQRALNKYHSPGLWTNACCSHPRPGETIEEAGKRRLKEELGFETELERIGNFVYRHEFENGLTEYEFDHVLAGEYEGLLIPDYAEVMGTDFKTIEQIKNELAGNPGNFTIWFPEAFQKFVDWKNKKEKDKER